MQKHGIQARGKRRFRVVSTDSKHSLPVAPNVQDRQFLVAAPLAKWLPCIILGKQTWMHSTLNYVSPVEYKRDWMNATAKIAA
jgi:hypothetical protein